MKSVLFGMVLTIAVISSLPIHAQQNVSTDASAVVPTLINFSGTLSGLSGKPISTITGVTFLLYKDAQGGAPLWMETQNVTPDKYGRYTVILGSTTAQGLPTDLFASGEARWLGVQPEGQAEQPRVLLVSVPYAMKAGDAQTVGGLPPSAFMLANGAKESGSNTPVPSASATSKTSPPANPDVTGKGTVDYIPMWDTTSDIISSTIFQKSGAIGIGTAAPAAMLDVNGKGDVRDTLTLFPKSTDNTLAVNGTTFKISSTGAVTFISGQKFPGAGTVTGVASGAGLTGGPITGSGTLSIAAAGVTNAMLAKPNITLNTNSAGGLTTPGAMTLGNSYTIGLKPCSANQILEYSGSLWNCSSAGTGTITGVTAGSDLTGGGTNGSVTVNLDTTKVPLLASANTFTAEQIINSGGTTPSLSISNTSGAAGITSTAVGAGVGGWTTSSTAYGGVEGYDGSSSGTGGGVYGYSPSGYGVKGASPNGYGVVGSATTGAAVYGTATSGSGIVGTATSGYGVYGSSSSGGAGVWGVSSSTSNQGIGVWGESYGSGAGVSGTNGTVNGTGVWGSSTQGYGFATDSQTTQARGMGGWVKAMVYLNAGTVTRCFNSQIAGSSAATIPCGINVTYLGNYTVIVDFGFEVDDRFVIASFAYPGINSQTSYCLSSDGCPVTSTQVYVDEVGQCVTGDCLWNSVYLVVF